MDNFDLTSKILKEQSISYSKSSVSKEEDGQKVKQSKSQFSGNMFGLADKKKFTETDANFEQLKKGIEVEKEHTNDPNIAKKIALDHLAEYPQYYLYLEKMENQMKEVEGTKS